MFKLEGNGNNDKSLNCYINNILSYIFVRNEKNNGKWEAFKITDNCISAKPIDSDRYRYDLAERLNIK